MFRHLMSIDSPKCAGAILPFLWVVVGWIDHLIARRNCRQDQRWGAKCLVNIDLKFVLSRFGGSIANWFNF
jgi:hypothetical protein